MQIQSQMASNKKLPVLFLLVFFLYLRVYAASSSVIQKGLLSSDSIKDIDLDDKDVLQHEHGTRNVNGKNYTRGGIAYGSKLAHGSSSGSAHHGGSTGSAHHGGSVDAGEHRNNGGAGYLYAGGAASLHHPQSNHGTSSCNRNCVRLFTFIFTAVASIVHLYI